jgi:hypothetical protein
MSIRSVATSPIDPLSSSSRAPNAELSPLNTFGDVVRRIRREAPSDPTASALSAGTPGQPQVEPSVIGEVGRQLLRRVARGEHYIESIVRQGLSGRAFTPGDLLAMQAQAYRYSQEIDLVSKLVDRATSTVKTVLQQNG